MKANVRKITVTALMSAVAAVLMFLSFSVPFMPSFIKFDLSELPALIVSFSLGPWWGVLVCFLKNLINVFSTTTGGVGELSNFLLGTCFVLPAGLIYKATKSRKGALIGSLIGALCMALISLPVNYFLTYPIYQNFLPINQIIAMYQAIFDRVNGLFECLLIFNVPYTFFKGMASVLITFLIYKHISPILKGKRV